MFIAYVSLDKMDYASKLFCDRERVIKLLVTHFFKTIELEAIYYDKLSL